MRYKSTVTEQEPRTATTQSSGVRGWFRRAVAVGALALSVLGGGARLASAQGLTAGGPIDFGSQAVGSSPTSLTLTFSATVATTISSVNALTLGVANRDFTILSQTCTGTQSPPQSCTVSMGFSPLAPGLRKGVLTLVDGSSTVVNKVFLHGVGLGALVVEAPAPSTAMTTLNGVTPANFQASAVALDGDGSLYFNDIQFSRILKMTPAGVVSQYASLVTTRNSAMAFDGAGTLYVTSGATVYRIPQGGQPVVFPTGSITIAAPRGVAVDGTGYVYLADSTQNQIVRVAPDGTSAVLAISGLATPLSTPSGLSIDSANVLHIADTGNSRIVRTGIYTGTTTIPVTQVTNPLAVAVDASAATVVTDTGGSRMAVAAVSGGGYLLDAVGATFSDPVGVVVKDNGDVVVADTANGLISMARAGSLLNYPDTFVGATHTLTDYIQNAGSVGLQFVVPTTGTSPAFDDTEFSVHSQSTICPQLTPASAQDASTQFPAGNFCRYLVDFTPNSIGTHTGHSISTLSTLGASPTILAPSATYVGKGVSPTVAFTVTATPNPVQPGTPVAVTVTATTQNATTDSSYVGTVTVTTNDAKATFPGGALTHTFTAADHGTYTFPASAGVVFGSQGLYNLHAADVSAQIIGDVTVLIEEADSFSIVASPSSLQVGQSAGFTVSALFQGAVVTNYDGKVTLSATDPRAVLLSGNSYVFRSFDQGVHTFTVPQGVQFNSPGTYTIGVAATLGTATGTSNPITVSGPDRFLVDVSPRVTNAGVVNTVTVAAAQGASILTGYTGTITFTSTDSTAMFPAGTTYTFTAADNGVHTFTPTAAGVQFNQGGVFNVRAADGAINGTSNDVTVVALTGFNVTAAENPTVVGKPDSITVTAIQNGSVATNFTGVVTLVSTDSTATFPGGNSYQFTAADNGVHTFAAPASGITFNQTGLFTVTAGTDVSSARGTSTGIRVLTANQLVVTASPTTTAAGSPVAFTITAQANGTLAPTYRGTVTFTSTDPAVKFLSGTSYTFTAADNGTHTFLAPAGVTFNTAGLQSVTANDGFVSGTSNAVNVLSTAATNFVVTPAATTVDQGAVTSFTVTAMNGTSVQTNFAGTVTFTSTDATAVFPAGTTYTFTAADAGVHTFTAPGAGVQFNQTGTFTFTATAGSISGTSPQIHVISATDLSLVLSPTSTIAGSPVALTVTASFNGVIASNYRGTVVFTSTDPAVAFLGGSSYTFTAADAGTHTFAAPAGVQFNTTGVQTVTGVDGQLSATSNGVTVNPAPVVVNSFSFTVPATATVGTPVSYTITALSNGVINSGFTGTVTLTSSDSTAIFPGGTTYTFTAADAGTHTFTAPAAGITFGQTGTFTITATNGATTATSAGIVVGAAPGSGPIDNFSIVVTPANTTVGAPVSFSVTPLSGGVRNTSFTGTVSFSSTDGTATFQSGNQYTFTAADQGTHTFTAPAGGVTFKQAGTFTLSAVNGAVTGVSNNVVVGATSGTGTATGFAVSVTPSSTTVGTAVSYTVTAVANGVTATGFTGPVSFTSTDGTAAFLSGTTYTFTAADNGVHTFAAPVSGIKFNQAGTFTVTASNGAISGTSGSVTVTMPSTATIFSIAASPTTTGIGMPVSFTIAAADATNAIQTGYTGTVTFSSSDPLVKFLGGNTYTFSAADAGVHTFSAANGAQFNTAGLQAVSATDGTISGTSNLVSVVTADSFSIVATPSTTSVGAPVNFTLTAQLNGATATNFTGTVTLSSTDGLAKFLGGNTYTFTAADAGVHTFTGASAIEFESAGVFTISANSGTLTGTSNNVDVTAASGFTLTVTPSSTTAGAGNGLTISATNGGTVVSGYTGTVTFTSTDATAKFLSGTTYTFTAADNGTHTFNAPVGVQFNQGGTFTVSATDGTLNGTSNNVTVLAATAFQVTAVPSTTTVGTTISYTVTAVNGSTVIPNYTGTVSFTSTDASATFLAGTSYTFTAADNGSHTFNAPVEGVAFGQAGTFTITATQGAITGTSNNVIVSAGGNGFTITATPTSTTVGTPVSFTISATNGASVNTAYRGTVTFTSTDATASFLSGTTYTFTAADNGSHTFTAPASGVAFNTGGTFTIAATDGTQSGTSNAVSVMGANSFIIVATPSATNVGGVVSYTVTAVNAGAGGTTVIPNYTGTVTFTSSDSTAKFPAGTTYTFTAADKGTHSFAAPASGVQFNAAGTFTVTATQGAITGTSNNVIVSALANAFTITATPSTTTVGAPVSFTISATNGGTVVPGYVGTVTFTTTDATGKFLSGNTYTFTAADNGTHTFTAPVSGVQFNAAGTFTVSATDGTSTGTSNAVLVNPVATGFTIVASPATTTIGTPVSFTISATNGSTVVTNYNGTVAFTTTDATGKFLAGTSYTFTAADKGTHAFTAPASGVQFNAQGTFTVTGTDGTLTGTSNSVKVNPVATGFTITATPSATTVGTPVSFTVTAVNGTTAFAGYTGTVTLSSTDSSVKFLSGATLTFTAADNGTKTFTAPASGVQFNKAGTFTISGTDGTLTGTSNAVQVNPVATNFSIVATPSTTPVGTAVSFTITALNGATAATAYTGTVTLTATDATAKFPGGATVTFTAADNGTKTFTAPTSGVQFNKTGTFTITGTDGTITGTSNSVVVNPLADGFSVVVTPSVTNVGTVVSYTVTALSGTTTATNFVGNVAFSSTDTSAKFLAGGFVTFTAADNGVKTFTAPASGVQFNTAGTFTVSATDGTYTGTSNSVLVNPVATGFTIVATPATTSAGTAVSFTLSATNAGTVIKGYTGTVTLTTTDATAKFLAGTTYTFTAADNGTHTFTAPANGVQFNSPGSFTISATDGTLNGVSNAVTVVGPNAFTVVASPSTTILGTPVGYTITAAYNGAAVAGYTGTVTLSTTDPRAKFLSGNTFTFSAAENGVHVVPAASGVQFNTLGTFTIHAAGNAATVTGTSNNVIVESTSTTLLTSSVNPILVGATTTLTATVPSAAGTAPTGTVTFLDGTTPLGTGAVDPTTGTATLSNVSFTVLGTHNLTASYGGDANFAASTSPVLGEIVEDFSIGIAAGGTNSLTALAGHTATYQLALTPLGGTTFAAPITFTASGLPAGATISFTPTTLGAGGTATTVAFSVTPALKVGSLAAHEGNGTSLAHLAPWTLALLALGAGAFGNRRKRITNLLLLTLAALPLTAMTGCLSSANDGYYGAAPGTYTITITATSGTITHTQQVTLSTQ